MCGKNRTTEHVGISDMGSPPRVREKRSLSSSQYLFHGITPACAGKTNLKIVHTIHYRDHPRVCGKNHLAHFYLRVVKGSPPRVREKPIKNVDNFKIIGITPACAGKTLKPGKAKKAEEDHPRVCGKNAPKENQ